MEQKYLNESSRSSDDLRSAIKGEISFDSLCLKCLRVSNDEMDIHPFFEGSLCKDCSVKNNFFSFLESLLLRVFSNQKNLCSRNDINPVCSFSVTTPNA